MNNGEALVVIAVPIYKAALTAAEKASFLQLFSVLSKHPICLFTYTGLDLSAYHELVPRYRYNVIHFDEKYFQGISTYNKLLCSPVFYQQFLAYRYLLIYQLDAWVFKDELIKWCDAGYDYIGAPWFASSTGSEALPQFLGVGNGGFSLRKIESHVKALHRLAYIVMPGILFKEFRNKIGRAGLKKLFYSLTFDNNLHHRFGKSGLYEDIFFGEIAKKNYSWFKVPDMATAAQFSTETNAELLFKLNDNKLPFGCHAWERYEPDFWCSHIDFADKHMQSGYLLK